MGVTRFDLIPNNRFQTEGNCKITDMYIDYNHSPWQLVVEVFIDGVLYTRHFNAVD